MPPKRRGKKRKRAPSRPGTIPPEDSIDAARRDAILRTFRRSLADGEETLSLRGCRSALKELGVSVKLDELRRSSLVGGGDRGEEEAKVDEPSFLRYAAIRSIQMERSDRAFRLVDGGGKGLVVIEDLARVAEELDEGLTNEELAEMMEYADRSGEGMLSREDFARIARKVNL